MERVFQWLRYAIVGLSILYSATHIIVWLAADLYLPDFVVFWTAGRATLVDPALVYNTQFITEAQRWLTHTTAFPRPFAYPPTALLLFAPLAMLPVWWSYVAWNALSLTAYLLAARRFVQGRLLLFAAFSPAVVFTVMTGQTALLTAAAIMISIPLLVKRPFLAGVLMGLAGSVKPQSLLLAPLALAVGRHWTGLLGFFCGGAIMLVMSLVFGFTPWLDWWFSLREFGQIVEELDLMVSSVTPTGVAAIMGVSEGASIVLQIAGVLAGLYLVWWSFRQDDVSMRVVGLVCGGLLCSPYAMTYELAALVPVCIAALFSGRPWGLAMGLPLTTAGGMFNIPIAALAVIMDRRGIR